MTRKSLANLTPADLDAIDTAMHGEAAAAEAAREERRKAARTARERAQAELDAELRRPLIPGSEPHSLERIASLQPKAGWQGDIGAVMTAALKDTP